MIHIDLCKGVPRNFRTLSVRSSGSVHYVYIPLQGDFELSVQFVVECVQVLYHFRHRRKRHNRRTDTADE